MKKSIYIVEIDTTGPDAETNSIIEIVFQEVSYDAGTCKWGLVGELNKKFVWNPIFLSDSVFVSCPERAMKIISASQIREEMIKASSENLFDFKRENYNVITGGIENLLKGNDSGVVVISSNPYLKTENFLRNSGILGDKDSFIDLSGTVQMGIMLEKDILGNPDPFLNCYANSKNSPDLEYGFEMDFENLDFLPLNEFLAPKFRR